MITSHRTISSILLIALHMIGEPIIATEVAVSSKSSSILPCTVALGSVCAVGWKLVRYRKAHTRGVAFKEIMAHVNKQTSTERDRKAMLDSISGSRTMLMLQNAIRPLAIKKGGYRYLGPQYFSKAIRYQVWELATDYSSIVLPQVEQSIQIGSLKEYITNIERNRNDLASNMACIYSDPHYSFYQRLGFDGGEFNRELHNICDSRVRCKIESLFDYLGGQVKQLNIDHLQQVKKFGEDIEKQLNSLNFISSASTFRHLKEAYVAGAKPAADHILKNMAEECRLGRVSLNDYLQKIVYFVDSQVFDGQEDIDFKKMVVCSFNNIFKDRWPNLKKTAKSAEELQNIVKAEENQGFNIQDIRRVVMGIYPELLEMYKQYCSTLSVARREIREANSIDQQDLLGEALECCKRKWREIEEKRLSAEKQPFVANSTGFHEISDFDSFLPVRELSDYTVRIQFIKGTHDKITTIPVYQNSTGKWVTTKRSINLAFWRAFPEEYTLLGGRKTALVNCDVVPLANSDFIGPDALSGKIAITNNKDQEIPIDGTVGRNEGVRIVVIIDSSSLK